MYPRMPSFTQGRPSSAAEDFRIPQTQGQEAYDGADKRLILVTAG